MAINKHSLDMACGKICADPGFIPVEIIEPVSKVASVSKPRPGTGQVSITLANGTCIALDGSFDLSDLAQLVQEIGT
jgi:hypothetical protein